MRFGTPDRIPCFEEGIREDVLKEWYQQGLSGKQELTDLFPIDHFYEIAPDLDPLPAFNHWPSRHAELHLLEERLNPGDSARLPSRWPKDVSFRKSADEVLFLRVHRGFFLSMGVHDWTRFEEVINLLNDDPAFSRDAMLIQGKFAAAFCDRVLNDIEVDAAIFHEPIGGNEGPLISPRMYREFVLESYRPVLDVLHKHKIDCIIFRTYANARILLPHILEYGMNCLWACENNSCEMDYRDIRAEYGKDLGLLGGIGLQALRGGKDDIRREVEEKVPYLLAGGGYLPMLDGRIRKDIKLENYKCYRRALQMVVAECTDACTPD
jgi:uroporphyrinogen decarboxylase